MYDAIPANSDGEWLPGQPEFERALAQGEYDIAKTRFVRSLDSERLARVIEKTAKLRARLREEIENLRIVVRDRHETAIEYARAYAEIVPHRVGRTWIQAPSALERIGEFHGSEKSYKRAVQATKDYVEAREVLLKRRSQLRALEEELRWRLDDREAALLDQLESPRSLRVALQLDPLLNISYQKLQALRADLQANPTEERISIA